MFELTFQNAPVILPYVKRGQVRALAVTSVEGDQTSAVNTTAASGGTSYQTFVRAK
jgi:hypothetical protein